MALRNDAKRFGALARVFHWLTLLLLIGAFTIAYSMTAMPLSPRKLEVYSWHKWVGVTIFLVIALRLGWRLFDPPPALPATVAAWQRVAAGSSHALLYAILFVMPVSGWTMSSALGIPVVYLGLIPLPDLVAPDRALGERLIVLHHLLGWALLVLVGLHVLAALHHHFVLRDDVLRRMLPWRVQTGGSGDG